MSRDFERAELVGGFGRGPVGGSARRSGLENTLLVESRLEHFDAISQGSSSIHLEVSLISASALT